MNITNWRSRWRLRIIITALTEATKGGLKSEVVNFARSLEATSHMARGMKKNQTVTIVSEREELDCFITYMHKLHISKLSLLNRARIGLAALCVSDKYILGEHPDDFYKREYLQAKHSSDDKRIVQIAPGAHRPRPKKRRR